jgi:hypothetical protein
MIEACSYDERIAVLLYISWGGEQITTRNR